MKKLAAVLPAIALLVAATASAHVSVRPDSVGVGKFQTFTVSVPSEKEAATTQVRLVLPEGLNHISPTVKQGWTINLVRGGADQEMSEHEEPVANITEIIWSRGNIPGHFRDDFTFSAQVPSTAITLVWKAYQTYSDGSVVGWALTPDEEQPKKEDGTNDYSEFGPASLTRVVNDLAPVTPAANNNTTEENKTSGGAALPVSIIALVLSVVALGVARKNRVK